MDRRDVFGYKNDRKDNKLRWELLPMDLIEWAVKVYTFGAQKYKPNSWQSIGCLEDGTTEYQRYKAALLRHMTAHEKGEFADPESGLPHLAHVLWNAIAILYFGLKEHEREEDDKFVGNGVSEEMTERARETARIIERMKRISDGN